MECKFNFLTEQWGAIKNSQIAYTETDKTKILIALMQNNLLIARIIGGLEGNEDYFTPQQLELIKRVFDNAIKQIEQ